MLLHDGDVHVGTLDPVPVTDGGTVVHIGHFTPENIVSHQKREIGKLALLEMVAYLAENFSAVQAITFSLSRDIEGYGDGMKLAGARAELLHTIGATHIVTTPRAASHVGHFVVTGVWEYNQANLSALSLVLQEERDAYGKREAAAQSDRHPPRESWLRRLLRRPGEASDVGETRR